MASSAIKWRFSEKLTSVFRRTAPSAISAPSSSSIDPPFLFTRLPYDIRVIVYSSVNTREPLAPKSDSLGLYLSCHQVKDEMDELTRKEVSGICATIAKTPQINLDIKLDPENYRKVKVTLPYTSFDIKDQAPKSLQWSRDAMNALHPLFALHLDTLNIHFSRAGCSEIAIPEHSTLKDRLELQDAMRNLLHDIGSEIDNQNLHQPHALAAVADDPAFREIIASLAPLPGPVRAKRICISWDLRAVPDGAVNLIGRQTERLEMPLYASSTGRYDWKKKFVQHVQSQKRCRVYATGYCLHDVDHLVGEVGIVSPSRWVLTESIHPHVYSLVDNIGREGNVISCEGLGKEFASGYGLVGHRSLEEVEKEVNVERARMDQVLWMRRRDELWMSYAMEGIFMDD